MRAFLVLSLMVVLFFCVSGCSGNGAGEMAGVSSEKAKSGSASKDTGGGAIVEAIKGKTLAGYDSTTIGSAFDSYGHFTKKEWKETVVQNGKIYVDFIGWVDTSLLDSARLKNGISARGVNVKFVVNPDGSFFVAMVSKVEATTDGKFYSSPIEDNKEILTKIYANKEMGL